MQQACGWVIVTWVVSVMILGGCDVADVVAPLPAPVAHDLLQVGDWEHFAGAEVQPDGSLFITALDRRIVEQDASGGQPNAPVRDRGYSCATRVFPACCLPTATCGQEP